MIIFRFCYLLFVVFYPTLRWHVLTSCLSLLIVQFSIQFCVDTCLPLCCFLSHSMSTRTYLMFVSTHISVFCSVLCLRVLTSFYLNRSVFACFYISFILCVGLFMQSVTLHYRNLDLLSLLSLLVVVVSLSRLFREWSHRHMPISPGMTRVFFLSQSTRIFKA